MRLHKGTPNPPTNQPTSGAQLTRPLDILSIGHGEIPATSRTNQLTRMDASIPSAEVCLVG